MGYQVGHGVCMDLVCARHAWCHGFGHGEHARVLSLIAVTGKHVSRCPQQPEYCCLMSLTWVCRPCSCHRTVSRRHLQTSVSPAIPSAVSRDWPTWVAKWLHVSVSMSLTWVTGLVHATEQFHATLSVTCYSFSSLQRLAHMGGQVAAGISEHVLDLGLQGLIPVGSLP